MLLGERYYEENGEYWYERKIRNSKTGRLKCGIFVCECCEIEFCRPKSHFKGKGVYCTKQCSLKHMNDLGKNSRSGDKHHCWSGGKIKTQYGYTKIYKPDHPSVKDKQHKYMFEHRLIMEEHIGRYLLPSEDVHHINGIKTDNRIENLELWAHTHPKGQRVEDLLNWAKEIVSLYEPKNLVES